MRFKTIRWESAQTTPNFFNKLMKLIGQLKFNRKLIRVKIKMRPFYRKMRDISKNLILYLTFRDQILEKHSRSIEFRCLKCETDLDSKNYWIKIWKIIILLGQNHQVLCSQIISTQTIGTLQIIRPSQFIIIKNHLWKSP